MTDCNKEFNMLNSGSNLGFDEIIENILDFARKMMDSDAAAIFIYSSDKDCYKGYFDFGSEKKTVIRNKEEQCEKDLFYFVTESGRPLVINNTEKTENTENVENVSCVMDDFGYATESVICVPMIYNMKLYGVLLAMNKTEGIFTGKDVDLFSTFANQAAVMIESRNPAKKDRDMQRINQELTMAKLVQDSFLPRLKDAMWGYCQFGVQKKAAAFNVSGDFYDLFPIEGNDYFFIFGDVSGKGIPAALMMANLLSRIRYLVFRYQKLSRIVFEMNNEVRRLSQRGMFVTLNCGILDLNRKKATYINCGHCPLILFDAEASNWTLLEKSKNIPLGIMDNFDFNEDTVIFNTGDMFLMVSDGVLEAKNDKGEEYTMERIISQLPTGAEFSAQSLVDQVYDSLANFCENENFKDDVTIFAVGNSLIDTRKMKMDFSFHQVEKKNEFIRAFLGSFDIPEQEVNDIMKCIYRIFLAAISRTEKKGVKEPLEVKLVSKLDSIEIGLRTFDKSLELSCLADNECKNNLNTVMDEVRFSRFQNGSHLLLVKKIK